MDHRTEQRRDFEKAAACIDPVEQGPLTRGDEAEPAHIEAEPLAPIVVSAEK